MNRATLTRLSPVAPALSARKTAFEAESLPRGLGNEAAEMSARENRRKSSDNQAKIRRKREGCMEKTIE